MVEEILERIGAVGGLANQLVLVVGPTGSGKTAALREVGKRNGFPVVVVGLALSEVLLDLPPNERPLRVASSLDDLVRGRGPVVLLDNLEILFDPSLHLDPLPLIDGIARSRTVVAAWNGATAGERLTYGRAGHPEYRDYPIAQRVVVWAGDTRGIGANQ